MKVGPLKRSKRKRVALLAPSHHRLTVIDADGRKDASGQRAVTKLLEQLRGCSCFVTGALTSMRHATPVSEWTCRTWRGKATSMRHDPTGITVTSLRGSLDGLTLERAHRELTEVLARLGDYGVTPGPVSKMSWDLWRATLSREVSIGSDPAVGSAAFFGGRQEAAEPRGYRHMASYDLRAAYPHSMGASSPYAVTLREVDPSTRLDLSSGLATARVVVPHDLAHYPLPIRLAPRCIQFPSGRLHGTWPWCELVAAAELGCEVTVERCWAPAREADLFGSWWSIVEQGRREIESPFALDLWKAICNSLWGQFAMDGTERGEVRWLAERAAGQRSVETEIHVTLPARNLPHQWTRHIAAETTARVRRRLLLEGLCPPGPGRPVHIDTDGLIVRKSHPHPEPWGDACGEWRQKAAIRDLEIRAPQLFRWTCGFGCGNDHPRWHYVASGVPASMCEKVFEEGFTTPISYRSMFDVVLPSSHSDDPRVPHWQLEALAMAGAR